MWPASLCHVQRRISTRQLQQGFVDQRAVDVARRWTESFRPTRPAAVNPHAIGVQPGEAMTRPDSYAATTS